MGEKNQPIICVNNMAGRYKCSLILLETYKTGNTGDIRDTLKLIAVRTTTIKCGHMIEKEKFSTSDFRCFTRLLFFCSSKHFTLKLSHIIGDTDF